VHCRSPANTGGPEYPSARLRVVPHVAPMRVLLNPMATDVTCLRDGEKWWICVTDSCNVGFPAATVTAVPERLRGTVKIKRMVVMQIVNRRALACVMGLLLVLGQHSPLSAATPMTTQIAATTGDQSRAEPTEYIGRMEPARRALTIILVPTEDNRVTAYYGLVGNIPFSDVKKEMLDRVGIFRLERPLSDGIVFENPYQRFTLRREADSRTPGSVMDGAVEFVNDGYVYSNLTNFFAHMEPVGHGK
jgi:hypothetical protein